MKHNPWIGALAFAIMFMMVGQTTGSANPDEDAVRKIEDEFAAAYGRNGAEALDRLMATDYTFVNPPVRC